MLHLYKIIVHGEPLRSGEPFAPPYPPPAFIIVHLRKNRLLLHLHGGALRSPIAPSRFYYCIIAQIYDYYL